MYVHTCVHMRIYIHTHKLVHEHFNAIHCKSCALHLHVERICIYAYIYTYEVAYILTREDQLMLMFVRHVYFSIYSIFFQQGQSFTINPYLWLLAYLHTSTHIHASTHIYTKYIRYICTYMYVLHTYLLALMYLST